ncbi:hypothetical protein [Herbidospora cretacea]|uniref:hypothetical protein n=1 Tax=Herbidospora cretacea TaxID=28444 RepID=UPI0007733B47|nr:hypothetical protein [Herbidospora cretacea]
MTLTKTKRGSSGDDLAELLRGGAEAAFRTLEARLSEAGAPFGSQWATVAQLALPAQAWLLHALHLLARKSGDYQRRPALARLIGYAPRRSTEPNEDAFEREVLAVSGWTEAVFPTTLTLPGPVAWPIEPAGHAWVSREVDRRLAAAPDTFLDPIEAAALGSAIQAALRAEFPGGRYEGPLYDGYDYGSRVRDSRGLPGGEAAQAAYVTMLGGDPTMLETDRELAGRIKKLITRDASHGPGREAHVPAAEKDLMVHAFLHLLAHPGFRERAGRLEEGLVTLFTAEYGGRTAPVEGPVAELAAELGSDRLKVAFFFGRTEFLGR